MSCAAGSAPPMLAEFLVLPTRAHSLLWYGIVDGEPRADTAGFLDITAQDVSYGSEGAFQTLRHSVLKTRLAGSVEAVHPDRPRRSADLDPHLAQCPQLCHRAPRPRSTSRWHAWWRFCSCRPGRRQGRTAPEGEDRARLKFLSDRAAASLRRVFAEARPVG
ncbi:hypothetical protein ABZ612_26240 [Streptomyces avermitilis]|uniref:hypothetical protein n=1 Tax=Streptomyces avermitilis TaxID=33903 RepID=UPI0033C5D87F